MTDPGMKCTRCRGPANHKFPAHNLKLCDDCLFFFARRQVEKAIRRFDMLRPGQAVTVAISGGKDSLVLWELLNDLGYETKALHLSLGLGEFSERSLAASRAMAERLGQDLTVADFCHLTGFDMDQVVRANRRDYCSVCGTMKRHFLNRLTRELGCDTVATGHHLDDEAGRLLGNMVRGHQEHLDRQWPVLEAMGGDDGLALVRKVKPMCRLAGDEILAYAKSRDLPAAFGSCPRSRGATLPHYQEAISFLDRKMPGTKRDFYFGFLRRKGAPPPSPVPAGRCEACGAPTHAEGICAACRLLQRARQRAADDAARDAEA